MRDYYTKENMQGETFHVPDAGLVFEPDRLAFEAESGTGREGVIRVRHRAGKPARGYVYPSEPCMHGVREQFAPAADGTGYIRWQFDARGAAPGRTVRGCFRVISPYGEYAIPYTVEISEKGTLQRRRTARRRAAAAGGGGSADRETAEKTENAARPQIRSKEDFLALAEEDFERAAALFYEKRLEEILTSEEDRTLYRGLSMQEGSLQNVEEFLIAACGKEKALFEPVEKELRLKTRTGAGRAKGRMAESRAERALEAHRQRVRNSGLGGEPVTREKKKEEEAVWLTLQIRRTAPCALRPAVRLEGRFLSGSVEPEPVPGSGDLWQARIPVDRAALHAGRNFGRVIVRGPFNETAVPVEVHCPGGGTEVRRRQERELELLQLQLMRLYVDVRLDRQPSAADAQENAGAGGHTEGWFLQADRLIDEISMRSHRDLIPRLYGVHLLILRGQYAEAQRELGRIAVRQAGADAAQNFSTRFTGEQEEAYCYRMYLYARCQEEDTQLRSRVVRFLRGIYRQTGSWRTAWMLLDLAEEYAPGTPARWNFLRHQFENGCSSPLIWTEAWDMIREDPGILLPGSSVQERWARDDFGLHVLWYAARAGALTDRAVEVMIELAEKKKTFSKVLFKALCAAWDEEAPREDLLRAICILLVRGQDLSPQAHKWYDRAMEAGVGLTRLEENWRQSMPADDSRCRLPAGRNAILRTTARRPVRAVLLYDRFREEEKVPLRGGVAFLTVYGDANTVFLEDEDGNRYAQSLPYALDLQEMTEEAQAAAPAAPVALTVRSERGRRADRSVRQEENPYLLAERIGFGNRGDVRLNFTGEEGQEQAAGAGRLLDSGLLTSSARTDLLLSCLEAGAGDEKLQRFFLSKADPAQCTAQERGELYASLADAEAFDQALRWLSVYGSEEIAAPTLARLCLGMSWDGSARATLISAGWDAFSRGNTSPDLLARLADSFSGLAGELLRLRKGCMDAALPTGDLDDRILRQMLFTGTVLQEHAQILLSTGSRPGEIFLPAVAAYADFAFSGGISMGRRMTELIAGLIADESAGPAAAAAAEGTGTADRRDRIPDICRIACLKELSMRQGDISTRERTAARESLSALLSKGIIFPFYRQFPGYDDRLDLYAEETLVQYHPAAPDDGRGRNIVFHYTTSRRGEAGNYRSRPMKEMYRDFFVSGFLLFYGEQMHYYITDDAAQKHVVQSGIIGQDARILETCSGRFGLINETTRAAALREYDEALSLLTGYYRRSYLESELFRR